MKKVLILLIALMVISVGLLSGCNEQQSEKIENKPPTVSISADSTFSYCSSGVSFEIDADDPDGLIQSCYVDFGDGTISQGYNFVHEYEKAGVYTVIVTVTDDKGNEAGCNITITIEESLTVSADADVTSGTFPLTVSFTGLGEDALGNITGYYWDFADGKTSNEQNTVHTFEEPDLYIVTLTVSNDIGENASDKIIIKVKHKTSFNLSGKIVNNYDEKVDFDYAVIWNFGNWDFWAPTLTISPYDEKDFSCNVKRGDSEYLIWAQWFRPGTNIEGCEISQQIFSNPSEEDVAYYIEIKSNGEIEISTTYHPPNPPKPPKTPEIIAYSAFADGLLSSQTHVFGEIKNIDSSNIKDVKIAITLYDSSNNVISKETVSPFISLIGPQKMSSFHATFWEDYYHHCNIEIKSFETTDEQTYDGLIITNHYKEVNEFNWIYIRGTIENTGSKVAESVRVNAVFYDSNGNIQVTENEYIGNLYSGEEESFEILMYDWDYANIPGTISSYELEINYYI